MTRYFTKRAYLEHGWADNVCFTVENGHFAQVDVNVSPTPADTVLDGPVLPTVANLHSHAFQRLMAGMAEIAANPEDSFWSWRDVMYKTATQLTPEELEVIASKLYIELLKGGFSQVGEFHYLHNQADGQAYSTATALGDAVLNAGSRVGMGVTLLPALYQYAGFGQQPANTGQQRFIQSTEQYIEQYKGYEKRVAGSTLHKLGVCFHSLRATDFTAMKEVLKAVDSGQPIHIHIAEQNKEVQDCLAFSGQRPVEWLAQEIGLSPRWTLIHATHLSDSEVQSIAQSGATVGICTTTEANLGDGIFPATAYEQAGGHWGVGSDSHVSTSLQEELRWFEYGQRLVQQKRNRLYSEQQPHIADHLFAKALQGGNQACDVQLGIRVGHRADFMVWDKTEPFVHSSQSKDLLNRWLFALSNNPIKDVYVAGSAVITDRQHELDTSVNQAFSKIVDKYFG